MQPTSHNTQQVKRINVELVKNTLRSTGVGTKSSVANLTKLSVATCGTILNELLQTGEIIDLGPDESSGGDLRADINSMLTMPACYACLFEQKAVFTRSRIFRLI